jgi:microcystin-dependent protein
MPMAKTLAGACLALSTLAATPALAEDCLIGEMKLFAGIFAPRGYALAQGQELQIGQYPAQFAIFGTTYGGNGTSTFKLPDMRGRVPIGAGMGPGLNNVNLGQKSGDEWTVPRQAQAQAGGGANVAAPVQITNMQPSTGLNYIVCLDGIFPSQ